jgi:glycosyltransferase involved in cell wall biosynthesis
MTAPVRHPDCDGVQEEGSPTIGVVIPCYNGERYLAATIDSVRSQTLRKWALTIVDDGGTDDSAAIAGRFAAADRRIRVRKQENRGLSGARNAGYEASRSSDYLLFLDADDLLEPDAMSIMVSYLEELPSVGLAYCRFSLIDEAGHPIQPTQEDVRWQEGRYAPAGAGVRRLRPDEPHTPLRSLMANCSAIPSTCFMRRSVFAEVKGWDEEMRSGAEDVDLVWRMALRGEVHFVPKSLVRYRIHPQSLSRLQDVFGALKALDRKWWAAEGRTLVERRRIREGVLFGTRVSLQMLVDDLGAALSRHDVAAAASRVLPIMRTMVRYAWRRIAVAAAR